jgi:hypothetical protein
MVLHGIGRSLWRIEGCRIHNQGRIINTALTIGTEKLMVLRALDKVFRRDVHGAYPGTNCVLLWLIP